MGLPSIRWLSCLLVPLVAGLLLAQKPPRPPEEEEPPKPATKPPEVEEVPITKKREIRVDEEPSPTKVPPRQPDLVVDLARAAKDARPPVRDLFRDLAKPADVVTVRGLNTRIERVEPIPIYVAAGKASKGKVTLRPLATDNKPGKPYDINLTDQNTVEYYETLALARVKDFRDTRWENLFKEHANYVSLEEQLLAVEQVLTFVLRFHDAARKNNERQGEEWEPIQEKIRKELLAVVMERLQLLVDKGDWDGALTLAQQLTQRFPGADDQRRIARPLGKLVEQVLAGGINEEKKYEEVQRRLKAIAETFPLSDTTEGVTKGLYDQADKLVAQARQLKEKNPKDAARLVQQAEEICPQYPGIRAMSLELAGQYPILRVGVAQLPQFMSPALAHTEAETQAIEMLFESLVQLKPDADGGTFVGQLAPGRPQTLPLGREFVLPRDLYWSDRKPLTGLDVRDTVATLRGEWGGRNEVWAHDLIDRAVVENDRHRVKILLRQGYIEPLAAMNFKILPRDKQPDDRKFAAKPVGSGPFMFVPEKQSLNGRGYVMFKANPYYSNRAGRSTMPYIREVQFFEPVDPVEDMSKGALHLLLDVPADKVKALRELPRVEVSPPLPTRRVYFLAVNHRSNAYLAQPSFRRALAHAISREKLLDAHFRTPDGEKMHQPLNGPYPPHSWAYNPRLKVDPYDAALAQTQLEQAEKAKPGAKTASLTLKYPLGDARVKDAMEALAKQIEAELKITIKPEGVEAHKLWEDVRERHSYDLAYWHHDFPDAMYDVWPLFDPRGKSEGGWNYLGYEPSAEFTRWFQDARGHRDFTKVRDIVHTIHELLYRQEMPLIPLWHLDRQIAVHGKLTMYQGIQKVVFEKSDKPPLDPLRLFNSVQTWKLEP